MVQEQLKKTSAHYLAALLLLLEELIESVGASVNFDTELLVERIIKDRNVPHRPLYTSIIKINNITILVIKYFLFEVNSDIRLG